MIKTTPSTQEFTVLDNEYQDNKPRNRFESFEQFKEFITTSFIDGSGIDLQLFNSCVEFHQDQEFYAGGDVITPIHDALNWAFTRFGRQANEPIYAAFLMNEDGTVWQAVLSLWDEDKQRPYRYLAPTGNGDRAFLPPVPKAVRKRIASRYGIEIPDEGSFWEWAESSSLPRIITEGGKKGLSALSNGYIAIALYGCRCGEKSKDEEGNVIVPSLVPDLARFHKEKSLWLFGFDRDEKPKAKADVSIGKRRLTNTLLATAKCYVEDIVWRPEQGKGLDDLIMNSGSGAFDSAYSKALTRLEKQFRPDTSYEEIETNRNPSADKLARKIAENHRSLLAFNNELSCWMRYGADKLGMWSAETDEYIEAVVYQIILAEGVEGFSSNYVSSVVKILRHELIERFWGERSPNDLLPFQNGVLEISTGKLLEHAPGYRLTWQLPRDYTEDVGSWEKINSFLEHLAGGNAAIKDLLICYCNSVLKGRHDLQKFVHLIGLGGTGKGTFARLVVSLIGQQNVHTTTLEEWCQNRFEGANAYRKRLVLFPDEDKQQGKLGKFLSLTGEDLIRAEEKRKKAFQYRYDGMVLVLSNLPIFTGDSASRVKRRVITVPCNNTVAPSKRRHLESEFEPELSAFTNYVLSISDDHVTNVLLGIQEIPECTLEFWENRMRVDSIAAWVNQQVIYDPMAETPVGGNRHEGANGETITTLFGSYSRHCNALGDIAKSHKNFAPDLLELCRTVIGWPIERKVTNTGKFVRGLRLRQPGIDDHISTHDYYLMQRVANGDGKSDGRSDGSSDGSEPLHSKEVTVSDGSSATLTEIFSQTNGQSAAVTDDDNKTLTRLGFKPKDTIRVIKHSRTELLGREETIERIGDKTIRTESGLFFSLGEFEKCVPAKKSPVFTALLKDDICWCSLHNKQAKIQEIIVSKGEAKVVLIGDIDIIRVKLSDLTALVWKPQVNHPAIHGNELVTVVGFRNRGNEYQIEYASGRREYVKASKLTQPKS